MRKRSSLQARLMLLIVAAILPLALLAMWSAYGEMQAIRKLTFSQLRLAASAIAASQDRTVDSARQMLQAMATVQEFVSSETQTCDAYFRWLQQQRMAYTNIGLLNARGVVVCDASEPLRKGEDESDRDHVRLALQGQFSVGGISVGQPGGKAMLSFGQPVQRDGRVSGVLFVSLDLQQYGSVALGGIDLPATARVLISDREGRILSEQPYRPGRPPGTLLSNPQVRSLSMQMKAGQGVATDQDGERRIFAGAPGRRHGGNGFYVVVSMHDEHITRSAMERLREQLALVALTLVAGLLAAVWIGKRAIVNPTRRILDVVNKLRQGDLKARADVSDSDGQGEFARIGSTFNVMADSLLERQIDLESELRRSRNAYELLETVLNTMGEGLVAVDPAGRVLLSNRAAAALLQASPAPADLREWPAHYGLHAESGALLDSASTPMACAMRGESGEARLLLRNTAVPQGRLLRCVYSPLVYADGRHGALVVFADETELERRRWELMDYNNMLKRSADAARTIARQRSVQETMQAVVDQARHVLQTHQAVLVLPQTADWEELLAALSMAQRYARWTGVEAARASRPVFEVLRATGRPLRLSHQQLTVHPVWHELTAKDEQHPPLLGLLAAPLLNSHGQVIGSLQVSDRIRNDFNERDEHVAAELAQFASIAIEHARLVETLEMRISERTMELARQERRYRVLAEQAPEIVWNADAQGKATFFNRAWYELVGGAPEDWLGHGWMARIHPEDLPVLRENWAQALRDRSPYAGTRRILSRGGIWHTTAYRAVPVPGEDGNAEFWIGIDSDITALKAVENALRDSNHELEAFSYSVSHDLRAPLSAIDGFSRAVAERLEPVLDDRARHYLARIRAGVQKMEQLIEGLLQLSRLTRASLRPVRVDLGELAAEALEVLQSQQPGRQITMSAASPLHAVADAQLMRVLMNNLIGNAWKFTAGAQDARIEVGQDPATQAFFVRDNGVGFDMAQAGKLFNAFHRLHSEAEFPGTGIGLATVRRVVSRHNGRVWAESEVGRGTTIWFTLQTVAAEPVDAQLR